MEYKRAIPLFLVKRLEAIQYHYNAKHDIIFLTALESPNAQLSRAKRNAQNAANLNDHVDMEMSDTERPVEQPSTSAYRSANTEESPASFEYDTAEIAQTVTRETNSTESLYETKIYLPHLVFNDIDLMNMEEIQDDLYEWTQKHLEKPPSAKHVVLAIVDPSFTIVYYKLTKDCLDFDSLIS